MGKNEYVTLAVQLFNRQIDLTDVQELLEALPRLDEPLFEEIAQEAQRHAPTTPRLGYDIIQIAYLAAGFQNASPKLKALSAWHLARAANAWAQPLLVTAAIRLARQGFLQINEPAWLAACDWQTFDISWMKGNLVRSAKKLSQALTVLENSTLQDMAPDCRLSLASNQIFLQQFDEAQANIKNSEALFLGRGDLIGQARCWLTTAHLLRRQNQFKASNQKLADAQAVFLQLQQTQYIARTYYHLGMASLFGTTDQAATISYFSQAEGLFSDCETEVWQGMCQTFLGATYLQDGELNLAEQNFEKAEKIFRRHHTPALLADNFTTAGLFNLAKGNPQKSIVQFKQGQRLHQKIGQSLYAAVDIADMGKAYCVAGRYQDGLNALEKAREILLPYQNSLVVADCEEYMASAWFSMRNFHQALNHLEKAEELYRANGQNASLITISNLRAHIYFETNDLDNTLRFLKESLQRSLDLKLNPQAALSHRLIGEVATRTAQFDEAFAHLESALDLFTQMGMSLEQAACETALGAAFAAIGEWAKAEKKYSEALRISKGTFTEIDWHALAGQAALAEKYGNPATALELYEKAARSLKKIRSNFWQPGLASSYAGKPAELFAQAIRLAVKMDNPAAALAFIEGDKATSLINQFSSPFTAKLNRTSHELEELKAEINWLQEQMRASFDPNSGLKSALQTRQFRQHLAEKSQQFDEINSRLERRSHSGKSPRPADEFDPARLRAASNQHFGANWAAVDYYVTADQIYILTVTPTQCTASNLPLTPRIRLALESCRKSQLNGTAPEPTDLQVLGNLLIPSELAAVLRPQVYLLLSPYGPLHDIPWNALSLVKSGAALVERCIPVVVPSFHTLCNLWKAAESPEKPPHEKGLAVGIADFAGMHPALPFVEKEIEFFAPMQANGGKLLKNAQATWENLLQISRSGHTKGLSDYAYLHLASHFFSDSSSGRLSGFAMRGENIYLDQLRELAPLPELVTFSGCSSVFSLTYAGDEQVGLPTTCLLSGAKTVIGCYWPVADQASARFMINFYEFYNRGLTPAAALAQTQRKFISTGERTASWAGYLCIGAT